MRLPKDLREFIGLLNSHGVEYVLVGAYAMAYHTRPRYTDDIDILVRPSPENAVRLEGVIQAFGFTSLGLSATDFQRENRVVQLGHPPNRIDILTSISGVSFEEAWQERQFGDLDGLHVPFLNKGCLVRNKRASGRDQDLEDLKRLT
ncbi:MAG: hypothetical protein HY238_09000 [Acidobacteria bacterium]|nr:hypothetical protein [Acidobacteriota bacterium]